MNRLSLSRLPALLAAFVAGLLVASAAAAQPPGRRGPGPGPNPLRFIEKHAERLGLSDEARTAIGEIVASSFEESSGIRAELDAAHGQMRALLEQEEPDEAAVMQQAERIGALEIALAKNRLRALLAIRKQLTPEQRAELVKIREEMGPRGRGRQGPRGRFGPPPGFGPPPPPPPTPEDG